MVLFSRIQSRCRALSFLAQSLVLYLGLGLLGAICLAWTPWALLLHSVLPRALGARIGRGAITGGFRAYLRCLVWLGACRFDLSAMDELAGQGALIIAPNHPCLLDAVMVVSRLPVVCIMKSQLMNNLFLGAGARMAGYISNDSMLRMAHQSVVALKEGQQLLMFPEGTRSSRQPIGPLMGGVGLIASRAQVAVQAVLIETDSLFLTKGWPLTRLPRFPICYRIRLGPRFMPRGDAQWLTAQLDDYFQRELAERAPMPSQFTFSSGAEHD